MSGTATAAPEGGGPDSADLGNADQLLKIDNLELARPVQPGRAGKDAFDLPEATRHLNVLQKQELLHELIVLHALGRGEPGAELVALGEFQGMVQLRLEPMRLISAGVGCMLAACSERVMTMRSLIPAAHW